MRCGAALAYEFIIVFGAPSSLGGGLGLSVEGLGYTRRSSGHIYLNFDVENYTMKVLIQNTAKVVNLN